jgi:predicted N-acetyltransferase YhbS
MDQIVSFEPPLTAGVVALCAAAGWESYTAERAPKALTAPGVTCLVALDGDDVIGVAQMLSDDEINAYLAILIVAEGMRNQGVGRALVEELFARTGVERMDLLSTDQAVEFYGRFEHKQKPGFRLYPAEAT